MIKCTGNAAGRFSSSSSSDDDEDKDDDDYGTASWEAALQRRPEYVATNTVAVSGSFCSRSTPFAYRSVCRRKIAQPACLLSSLYSLFVCAHPSSREEKQFHNVYIIKCRHPYLRARRHPVLPANSFIAGKSNVVYYIIYYNITVTEENRRNHMYIYTVSLCVPTKTFRDIHVKNEPITK